MRNNLQKSNFIAKSQVNETDQPRKTCAETVCVDIAQNCRCARFEYCLPPFLTQTIIRGMIRVSVADAQGVVITVKSCITGFFQQADTIRNLTSVSIAGVSGKLYRWRRVAVTDRMSSYRDHGPQAGPRTQSHFTHSPTSWQLSSDAPISFSDQQLFPWFERPAPNVDLGQGRAKSPVAAAVEEQASDVCSSLAKM